MKLTHLIDTYVTFKRSIGMRCRTDAQVLKSFCRATGDVDIAEVSCHEQSSVLCQIWIHPQRAVVQRVSGRNGHPTLPIGGQTNFAFSMTSRGGVA
jgi:hypothetical protein